MADRSEIDDVRARTDIVAVIEQYVTLKRAGSSLKGLCPFHNEKTPSFHVNAEKGIFHCYGCGEGGDVFKFVQKIENLSFSEALERLALRCGITLTQFERSGAGRSTPAALSERDRIYSVNGVALQYFREMLTVSDVALSYLAERGIEPDTRQLFALGYAPDAWDGLCQYLTRHRISLADAELAGLVGRSDRSGWYDRLRGRLIFPIVDVQQRPIAFGGRLMAPSNAAAPQPKYWNSPEHPAFSKSRTLYGLDKARKTVSSAGYAIVVEGYTDVISAYQAGFTNVVAPLGTALTEEHVRILARLAPRVLLCFDADSAGLRAAFRAAEIFEANEIDVKVLSLPDGEDPDSLLRAGRREEFAAAITNAVPMMEYRISRLIGKEAGHTDADRVTLMRKAMPILASVKSVIERDQYVKMLAPHHPGFRFGTASAEEQIRQDVAGYIASHSGRAGGREGAPAAEQQRSRSPLRAATDLAERHLLRAVLGADASLAERVISGIAPDQFLTETGRCMARAVFDQLRVRPQSGAASVIGALGEGSVADMLTEIVMDDDEPLSPGQVDGEMSYLRRKSAEWERTRLGELYSRGEATPEEVRRYIRLTVEMKGSLQSVAR